MDITVKVMQKYKVGLVVCVIAVGLLATSTVWMSLGNATLQKQIETLEEQITSFEADISNLQDENSLLSTQNENLLTQNQNLENNTANLQNQVDNLETENSQRQNQISSLQSQISTLLTNITELQAYIAELEGRANKTMWETIQERGTIRVGSSPDWPPYEYLNVTGEFIGFEVELMEMIAERLNLEVEWIEMSFDTIILGVKEKTIDLGVSGFSVTPWRSEVVQFTMPHSITEGQIIMLNSTREALGITEIDSLANLIDLGLTCGAEVGTTEEAELQDEASGALRTYVDYLAALDDMKRGAIDCVYAETPLTSWWILEAEEAGEEPLVVIYRRPYWPVAFVAHLDSDILVAKISGALAEIISEGKLDELKAKWKS